MHLKPTFQLIFAALLVAAVLPLHSQVSPAATQGGIPLVVGAGFSDYSIDWGPGQRMEGISAWADWFPGRLPTALRGLGIEAEGRDIDFGRPAGNPQNAPGHGPRRINLHLESISQRPSLHQVSGRRWEPRFSSLGNILP